MHIIKVCNVRVVKLKGNVWCGRRFLFVPEGRAFEDKWAGSRSLEIFRAFQSIPGYSRIVWNVH